MTAPTYRRPPSGQLDDPSADFGEALSRLEPLSAKALLDVQLAAVTTPQFFSHGLGRAYRGAILVAQEQQSVICVIHPRNVGDAAQKIGIAQNTAIAHTVRLLVF